MFVDSDYWGNVRRVVFALSEVGLYEIIGPSPDQLVLLTQAAKYLRTARDVSR